MSLALLQYWRTLLNKRSKKMTLAAPPLLMLKPYRKAREKKNHQNSARTLEQLKRLKPSGRK